MDVHDRGAVRRYIRAGLDRGHHQHQIAPADGDKPRPWMGGRDDRSLSSARRFLSDLSAPSIIIDLLLPVGCRPAAAAAQRDHPRRDGFGRHVADHARRLRVDVGRRHGRVGAPAPAGRHGAAAGEQLGRQSASGSRSRTSSRCAISPSSRWHVCSSASWSVRLTRPRR